MLLTFPCQLFSPHHMDSSHIDPSYMQAFHAQHCRADDKCICHYMLYGYAAHHDTQHDKISSTTITSINGEKQDHESTKEICNSNTNNNFNKYSAVGTSMTHDSIKVAFA